MPRLTSIALATTVGGLLAGVATCSDPGLGAGPPETEPVHPAEHAAADLSPLVGGNTRFALDLYARLAGATGGNLACSPQSISTALAMTYAGARGETAEEMRRTLHFDLDPARLHPAFGALERSMGEGEGAVDLALANRLWGRDGETFLDAFLRTNEREYGAGLATMDFAGATEAARKTINAWVEERTRGRIEELLQRGNLDPATVLVLTNAIYFKGRWTIEFDPGDTRDGTFHAPGGRGMTVPMMRLSARFRHHETDLVQVLELPYDGDRFAMMIVLPRDREGLAAVERSLTPETLAAWVDAMNGQPPETVALTLPRFRAEARYDLAETLAGMGMPLAFSAGADFSGMNGKRDLFIGLVVHQALVEVNEEGTEAAAATAVVMQRTAAPRPRTFIADHPFVYLIRDRETGSVMFLGRVAEPVSPEALRRD